MLLFVCLFTLLFYFYFFIFYFLYFVFYFFVSCILYFVSCILYFVLSEKFLFQLDSRYYFLLFTFFIFVIFTHFVEETVYVNEKKNLFRIIETFNHRFCDVFFLFFGWLFKYRGKWGSDAVRESQSSSWQTDFLTLLKEQLSEKFRFRLDFGMFARLLLRIIKLLLHLSTEFCLLGQTVNAFGLFFSVPCFPFVSGFLFVSVRKGERWEIEGQHLTKPIVACKYKVSNDNW